MKTTTKPNILTILVTTAICLALLAAGFLYVKTLMGYEERISYLEVEWEGIQDGKEVQEALLEIRVLLPQLNKHLDWLKALFEDAE